MEAAIPFPLRTRIEEAPSAAVHLEIYPGTHAFVIRTPLFTLACTEVSDVRRSGHRLTFEASAGTRRVRIAISRSGTIGVHYRDEIPQPNPWQQGLLEWDGANTNDPAEPI